MTRDDFKTLFQRPGPNISSGDRTQQLRSKTVYAGTVNLAKTISTKKNTLYKTYTGPYEVVHKNGVSTLVASKSYHDLLSITKGKVLTNKIPPLNTHTQPYYEKAIADGNGEMYIGNYNQFDLDHLQVGSGKCTDSVLVYEMDNTEGFTGENYNIGGYVGETKPTVLSINNKTIFVDPNHCYYSSKCLTNESYTQFVSPVVSTNIDSTGLYVAQQIIKTDQYRGFIYPMPNFELTCDESLWLCEKK